MTPMVKLTLTTSFPSTALLVKAEHSPIINPWKFWFRIFNQFGWVCGVCLVGLGLFCSFGRPTRSISPSSCWLPAELSWSSREGEQFSSCTKLGEEELSRWAELEEEQTVAWICLEEELFCWVSLEPPTDISSLKKPKDNSPSETKENASWKTILGYNVDTKLLLKIPAAALLSPSVEPFKWRD